MFRVILLVCAGMLPATAALANSDFSPFKNWVSLTKYMRAQGIEPTKVDWLYVEQLCAPLLDYGQESYNRCKFEKAEASYIHVVNLQECGTVARAEPRHIRSGYTIVSRRGHAFYRPYHSNRLPSKRQREASVVKCMKNSGWASANDWRLGAR